MSKSAEEFKLASTSIEGLDEVFEVSGTEGTGSGTPERTTGTTREQDPGHWGHETIDAAEVLSFISTAKASKIAGVDSRTIRRWHEQKKIRGHFSKGKLLVAQEDLSYITDETDVHSAGASRTEPRTSGSESGTAEADDPGRPGPTADISQTPSVVFSDVLDRIERLSRENGELKALLDEQRREITELRLITDNQYKRSGWSRFWSWFTGK